MCTAKVYISKFPIPEITTTAIIVTEEKVLLVKRKNDPFKGQWCFPGGFFNQFESARDCCIREVMEETGIDISKRCPHRPFDVISDKDRDPRGWVIDCPFLIQLDEEVPCKAQDDAEKIGWFTFKEVDRMPLAFDHNMTWATAVCMID